MSKITRLAECTITAFHTITIELVETDEIPAVILIHWPTKHTVLHPRRFPAAADTAARTFAAAVVALAQIRRGRKL